MTSGADTENSHIEYNPFLLLSDTQWRFITLRIDNPAMSKKDAAEALSLSPETVYHWPKYVNDAEAKAREDMHSAALTVRKNALLKAMRVKTALLNSEDERIRDKAATDILEWELGKANQPLTGKDGGDIRVTTNDDSLRADILGQLCRIADAQTASLADSGDDE